MTHRSLSTPNNGLRVFSASLLSALLIMMPFVQLAAAQGQRVVVRGQRPESKRQAPNEGQKNSATNAAAENVFLNAPIPKPAPEAAALAPTIVATKDDGLATATTVAPGGTINYSVNIKNNGTLPADDATGVVFTDIIDAHTTLVVGSAVAAVSDRYSAIGNVQLSIPDGSTDLLSNDIDPDTGNNTGMTVTAETKSSAQCTGGCSNNVTINLDGSFTYDPPVGFSGTDTFTYTAHSTVGPGTATETVTITVANEIWFINNNAGACPGAPCDGRLTHPFVSLAAFTAANLGGAGQPGDNDWIFIYESAADYVGPATLRNGQKFIGQDATASLASLTGFPAASGTNQLPGMNTGAPAVTITTSAAATNGINLLSGNTLRGFTVGNTTAADIAGTSFGTLTAADINLNGTGRPLNLTTGTLAATFGTLTSTSSSGGAGISLSGVGGTLTVTGAVSITGASTQGISISGSTLNATFGSTLVASSTTQGILIGTHTIGTLAFGNTTITGGTNGVSFQNNASGSRTFGTLDISGGANEAFLHGAGGGNVTVTGAANLSSAGSAISVSAPAATNAINFQAATSATTTGAGVTAVSWSGAVNTSITFNSLSITRNNAIALGAGTAGTVNVTNATGSITATTAGGPAIVASNVALNANFLAINSSGGLNGVNLNAVTGTSNFGGGLLTGTASGITFLINGGTTTVTYSGNITQGAAAGMVSIIDHTTGTITFQTGTLSATLGTGISFDNADGIYNFTGTTNLAGGNAHIDIIDSTGGTISFGANTTITNPSGVAVNVDGTTNPITAGITIAGSISKTSSGRMVDFFNYDTGTANISASLSCTSSCGGIEVTNNGISSGTINFTNATKTLNTSTNNAVQLDNNDNGFINFTGNGLDIDTTTGIGFNAINGGTVTVTGTGNSINSVSAAALTVTSTTIGAGDLIFQRIDSGNSTAAADPVNGIVLNATGSSGNLTVTGNSAGQCGGAVNSATAPFTITAPVTADCTGGEIQSTTGAGILLTNTSDVSLTRMWIHNTVLSGIDGTTVTNFTFDRGLIEKSGLDNALNAVTAVANVSNIGFNSISGGVTNITGTVTVTRSTLRNAFYNGVSIYNENGVIADLVIGGSGAGNAINSTTSTVTSKGSGVRVIANGAAASAGVVTKATVGHNSVLNFPSDSGMKILGGNAAFGPQSTLGIPGSATDIFSITNNEVKGPNSATPMGSNGIETAMTGTGRAKFSITNNGTATNPIQHFLGIGITCSGGNRSQLVCLINNNFIDGGDNIFSSRGMAVGAQVGYPGDTTSNGTVNISVTNNTVNNSAGQGIFAAITNSNISGNILIQNNNVGSIRDASTPAIRVESGSSSGDTNLCLNLSSNTATGNAAPGIGLRKQGIVATTNDFGIVGLSPSPANPNQTEDYVGTQNPGSNLGPVGFSNDGLRSVRAIVHSGNNFVVCTQPAISAMQRETQEFLASVRAESSTENTLRTGNTNSLLSFVDTKDSVDSIVENFNRGSLVAVSPSSSEIKPTLVAHTVTNRNESSDNAASQTSEVRTHHAPSSKLEARNTTRDEGTGLRAHYATLSKLATRSATAAPAPMSGETVTANIGTLPAGGSVTISFQVTVNNPPNLTLLSPPRVENQGTVSGSNFANVLTDDPNVGGAADKTATQIDLFGTTTTVISSGSPTDEGDPVTFTATVAPNNLPSAPPLGTIPTGTVQFLNGVTPITCNEGSTSIQTLNGSGQATCTTSTLTSAGSPHTINVNYNGDGNFDPSSGNTTQVINACTQNPVVINTNDSGAGSLREALATVCTAPNNNITFNIDPGTGPHTITLTTGVLVAAKNANIKNSSGESITVSGGGTSGVFNINLGKTVNIIGLSITGGSAANGAGVLNNGTLNLVNSTVFSNTATSDGGGIQNTSSATSLTLINTTVSSNNANGFGGGVDVLGGTVTIINSTITGNHGDNDDTTLGGGGGVRQQAGTVTLHNTIVAGNFKGSGTTTPNDIEGTMEAASSNNLVGDAATSGGLTHGTNGNIVGNAGVGTIVIATVLNTMLANNGGLTATHALVASGPAVEAGSNANLPADTFDVDGDANTAETLPVDQRGVGYPRTADSADADTTQTVDIGAFELHPSVEDITDKTTAEDTPFNFNFNLGDDTGTLITGGTVTATSSNQTLVPDANLVITGSGGVRNLAITPAADANSPADGTATITVTVTATNGRTAVDTFVVTVTEVNDAPVPTNDTVPDVAEDSGTYVIPFATLLGNDTNKGAANESGQTLNITAVSSPTGGGVAINGTNVEFTPTADYSGPAGFTYTVTDDGTTNLVSDPKTGNATVSFNITAVNDPPSFTILADPPAVNEDAGAQTVNSFATSISAGPGETQTLTFNITPTGTTGNLSFASGPAINTSTGDLTYTTNADTNGTASFSVTLSDDGGGTDTSAPQSFTITVNAVDDAPTFTLAAGPTVAEDAGAQSVPSFASNFQPGPVTATDESTQTLVGYTLTQTGSTGGLTFSGTPAIDNAGTLTYTATGDTSGTATFDVVATDTGSNTPPNVNQSAPQSFTITVNAANDAPVNTVPGPQGTASNTPLTFSSGNGNQISVADADAGASTIQVTLTATDGTLTLSGTTGLNFGCGGCAGDGTADATMTFQGTLTDINAALNGLTYTPNLGFSGPATLTITSNDLGNTGSGGALSDTDVVNIQVATEIRINDGSSIEPASPNTIDMVFTVSLNSPAPAGGVSVNFSTQDEPAGPGKAVAGTCGNPGADYVATNGTVTFSVGQQVRTINVPVCSDAVAEPDETFKVLLFGEVGGTLIDGDATGTIKSANTAGAVVISELRTSGPGGAGDDFVEIYNNSNSPLTVAASDASAGYGLYKMGADCNATPVLIGVIPNGTVIPARGHYLFVGSAYSLTNYGGTGAAAGNLTLSADIETDANVGLFTTSNIGGISSVNRLDAVGFGVNVGGVCDLLREPANLTPIAGNATLEHSYFRKMCDWQPGVGCTVPGVPKDTNNNLADFWLADTTASAATGRLGAPGPENLASPIRRDNANNPGSGGIDVFLLDGTVASSANPNRTRNGSAPEGSFGTMILRHRVVNNTGAPVTRLRYRIVDVSTAIQGVGPTADLRALTSSIESSIGPVNDSTTCTAAAAGSPPCTVVVQATTLETPPNQAIGGGYNSTLSSGTITTGTPLNNGSSILINFKLGVEKTGSFRFFIIVEALP